MCHSNEIDSSIKCMHYIFNYTIGYFMLNYTIDYFMFNYTIDYFMFIQ